MQEPLSDRGVPGGAAPRAGGIGGSALPPTRRTRFAPSPTGLLHLGHAFSALTASARATPGQFLLRIEDIDTARSRPDYETALKEDLHWLDLSWPEPALRQSDRRDAYDAALARLAEMDLLYPCRCTRADIRAALSAPQEGMPLIGPDGPVYPGTCRERTIAEAGPGDAIRLDMQRAVKLIPPGTGFLETGPEHPGLHLLDAETMLRNIGDIVLARGDIGVAYHLAVVVDDAFQQITEVVRGEDLFEATFIHRLLQLLLALPTPDYHHHRLIRDENGKRLAKRDDDRAIRHYRAAGATPDDIRAMLEK
ncbi:glutamyl-tRNA synthetase [Haematobacter missouriensis]|uniref:tRNA glutamyl-Q(34) synthetase GluQRS n=1 Tax=Haematobacter missouriensis TaxID=366616 RepID=A0A212AXK0_9RHOB|nr:tRNA glutamyl-Q(34) synthetase GluQRS [Haematobacter missouriensis]KFI34218.1 glutamyl-tRNA synthetase [Haematobacter missouriensis]OWJ72351.1 tRNA glutamyl-Q(34) synthetase GluQRS [Haematobacter missouriensis]OWJ86200.1 tRNA glutamyl-Q(34) synthetase GluQRS [Haematobacter missouriensis]